LLQALATDPHLASKLGNRVRILHDPLIESMSAHMRPRFGILVRSIGRHVGFRRLQGSNQGLQPVGAALYQEPHRVDRDPALLLELPGAQLLLQRRVQQQADQAIKRVAHHSAAVARETMKLGLVLELDQDLVSSHVHALDDMAFAIRGIRLQMSSLAGLASH